MKKSLRIFPSRAVRHLHTSPSSRTDGVNTKGMHNCSGMADLSRQSSWKWRPTTEMKDDAYWHEWMFTI
jgi:hypothetical protein